MNLSIVVPAYNEARTIEAVLCAVAAALPGVAKQIVVVDDGSSDGTRDWLRSNIQSGSEWMTRLQQSNPDRIECLAVFHETNRGKGAALRTGLERCRGDVVVVQDADLEYDPSDWHLMWNLIAQRKVADVVYGSRFYGRPHRSLNFHHFLGNKLISWLFNLVYNQTLTDVEVCYKMFRREVVDPAQLSCDDFGIEIEISARIARGGPWRVYELGISYFGRTYAEGKKINWRDGFLALYYIFKYRFR